MAVFCRSMCKPAFALSAVALLYAQLVALHFMQACNQLTYLCQTAHAHQRDITLKDEHLVNR
jgi:ferric-dicitrate binding protein FerR (iron transport regulator)